MNIIQYIGHIAWDAAFYLFFYCLGAAAITTRVANAAKNRHSVWLPKYGRFIVIAWPPPGVEKRILDEIAREDAE